MTAKKRATAKSKTKKTTARSTKSTAAPKKRTIAKKPAAAKKKAAVAKKKTAAPKKKAVAAPKKVTARKKATGAAVPPAARVEKTVTTKMAAVVAREVPPPRPSERAMAVAAQLPSERALTDEEREAMSKVAQTALAALETDGVPDVIVTRIGSFVDEIRTGRRPEPNSQDVRLGLGVLWGEQVRAQVGWRWVHLSYPNGFASYALVPDDRAFACFPLNRLVELMTAGADVVNTSVPLFDSIRIGSLPARRENAYLVIG